MFGLSLKATEFSRFVTPPTFATIAGVTDPRLRLCTSRDVLTATEDRPVVGWRRHSVVCERRSVDGSMWWLLLLVALATAKRGPSTPQQQHEPVIEEVTAKQLERVLAEKDYVAVFWCK